MIYIFSDDSYFSLGAHSLLRGNGYPTKIIDIAMLSKVTFESNDSVLLSVDDVHLIDKIYLLASSSGTNIVNMVRGDVISQYCDDAPMPSFLSKKSKLSELVSFLESVNNKKNKITYNLTIREIEIMNELLKGKSNHKVSKELQISEKTVSGHKLSALKKLGLSGLNSRALVIYGNYRSNLQRVNQEVHSE